MNDTQFRFAGSPASSGRAIRPQYAGRITLETVLEIPEILCGNTVVLRIEQFTSIAPILGRYEDILTGPEDSKAWFPHMYEKCGIEALTLIGSR